MGQSLATQKPPLQLTWSPAWLACDLCRQTFDDPHVLCQARHIYCLRCIQRLTSTGFFIPVVKCPSCHEEVEVAKLTELPGPDRPLCKILAGLGRTVRSTPGGKCKRAAGPRAVGSYHVSGMTVGLVALYVRPCPATVRPSNPSSLVDSINSLFADTASTVAVAVLLSYAVTTLLLVVVLYGLIRLAAYSLPLAAIFLVIVLVIIIAVNIVAAVFGEPKRRCA